MQTVWRPSPFKQSPMFRWEKSAPVNNAFYTLEQKKEIGETVKRLMAEGMTLTSAAKACGVSVSMARRLGVVKQ